MLQECAEILVGVDMCQRCRGVEWLKVITRVLRALISPKEFILLPDRVIFKPFSVNITRYLVDGDRHGV